LAVEAKLLRGRGSSLAGKYVDEGVMDFVAGRYSRGHDHGVMLGYVVAPPPASAVAKVAAAMAKRRAKTREVSSMALNQSLTSHPGTYHSKHLQVDATAPLTVVHVFLDLTQGG
jgi:hypothetical protein